MISKNFIKSVLVHLKTKRKGVIKYAKELFKAIYTTKHPGQIIAE